MSTRVLIVDDEEFARFQLRHLLEQLGLEVAGEARNGAEAVELYRELAPDLVTMDVTMPQLDGIAATREILQLDPNARVVMITAMADRQRVLESVQAGARGYVLKPVEPERVWAVVRDVLELPA